MEPNQPKSQAALEVVWTVHEVASYLRVTTKTVYNLVERRELRSFRVGRVLRFHMDDVMRFVAKQRLRAGGDDGTPSNEQ